jgi:nucleotide-binding universal stress UspA family protein
MTEPANSSDQTMAQSTSATTIVAGHGRDPSSEPALAAAVDLASRLGAHLHVVHAVDLDDYPVDSDAADWEEQGERELAEQRAHVEAVLAQAGITWSYDTRRGDPADVLAIAADEREALLIVVGTRGEGMRAALERLLSRSVSHGLIRRQHRPVLVVPAPEPA